MTHTGQLIQKPFVDKRGNAIEEHQDLYLETGERELFIRVCASSVSESTLREHLGERVALEGDIEEGNWACEERVQSRVGSYLVIEDVRRLE